MNHFGIGVEPLPLDATKTSPAASRMSPARLGGLYATQELALTCSPLFTQWNGKTPPAQVGCSSCSSAGCNADYCYKSAMRGINGTVDAKTQKQWCDNRNEEGCGCQWVSRSAAYREYSQDRNRDMGYFGYCCSNSCPSTDYKGDQCCSCATGSAPTMAAATTAVLSIAVPVTTASTARVAPVPRATASPTLAPTGSPTLSEFSPTGATQIPTTPRLLPSSATGQSENVGPPEGWRSGEGMARAPSPTASMPSDRDWIAPNPADPADVGGLNEPRGNELPMEDRGGPLDNWSGDWTGNGAALKKAGSKPGQAGSRAFGIGLEPVQGPSSDASSQPTRPAATSGASKAEGTTSKGLGMGVDPLPV
jgi:hypothetical protein